MLDFKQKKRMRKTMYSTPVLVILTLVLFFVGRGTWNLMEKYSDARGRTLEAQAELTRLEAQKNDLQKQVAFLGTDRGRESEIREKFMVAKQGEGVIMVVDPKATTTENAPVPTPSAWDRFLNIFR